MLGVDNRHDSIRWDSLPLSIQNARDVIMTDMRRFNIESTEFVMSALLHPSYKKMEWLTFVVQERAHKRLVREACLVFDIPFDESSYQLLLDSLVDAQPKQKNRKVNKSRESVLDSELFDDDSVDYGSDACGDELSLVLCIVNIVSRFLCSSRMMVYWRFLMKFSHT